MTDQLAVAVALPVLVGFGVGVVVTLVMGVLPAVFAVVSFWRSERMRLGEYASVCEYRERLASQQAQLAWLQSRLQELSGGDGGDDGEAGWADDEGEGEGDEWRSGG